jgi:hypothetical protein
MEDQTMGMGLPEVLLEEEEVEEEKTPGLRLELGALEQEVKLKSPGIICTYLTLSLWIWDHLIGAPEKQEM